MIAKKAENKIPLYRVIADEIRHMISANNFDYQNPICTEKSICDKYKVSRITAKHAINQLEGEGLLYRRRGLGSYVVEPQMAKTASNRTYALVVPFSTTQGGIFRVVEALSRIFTREGHQITIHANQGDDSQNGDLLAQLYKRQTDGVIYYPEHSGLPLDILYSFVNDNRPVIILDKTVAYPEFTNVVCDNYRGGYLLTEHLISYGHTNICYLSRFKMEKMSSIKDRYRGYEDCLQASGIATPPRFVRWIFKEPSGYYMLKHLVNSLRIEGVTAILCENDEVAFNVYMCCQSLGIRIPEDMNITGFDNIEWATTGSAQITTIDQNFEKIGEAIASALIGDNYAPRQYTTPVHIIPRTSTGQVV